MQDERPEHVMSTAEKLLRQRAEVARQRELAGEELAEYVKALQGVAATEYGQHVLKTFIKVLGVFEVGKSTDGVSLVEERARRAFYLKMIRPHLAPEICHIIEE